MMLAHLDYARSTHGEDVYVLSPIAVPRPASGTARAGAYCTLCAQQVPVTVGDIASTRRTVLAWRALAWVSIVVFVVFAAWMLNTMLFVDGADTGFGWFLVYLPLCLIMLFSLDKLAKSDGVRLLDTDNHELRADPAPRQ